MLDALLPCPPALSDHITVPVQTLRFLASAEVLSALSDNSLLDTPPTPVRGRRLTQHYYDTPDFALARHRVLLRMSKTRRGHHLELSTPEGDAAADIPGATPDLAALGPDWEAAVATLLDGAAVHPVFTTDIKRVTRHAGEVEVGLETGTIQAGAEKLHIKEVVLSGPGLALFPFALALTKKFPMQLQADSVAGRGAQLAGAPAPRQVKAGAGLTGTPSLDEAVVDLTQSCLSQFLANWPAFYRGDEIGAVHQMRVAMRRLRSVLGLFSRAFPAAELAGFRNEARRIANVMGEARNWDVFMQLLHDGPAAAFTTEAGMAAILDQCRRYREAGYEAVHALLADPATSRFVLTVESFLARHGWRNGVPAEALDTLTAPALDFATANLLRLHRKVRKRGKRILSLSPHDRHLVRIELKKLRYAADLFGGLFSARNKVKQYSETAAGLQEELGHLNDLATARELLDRLDGGKPDTVRAIGIVLGWCAHSALADDTVLEKRWKAFTGTKPFAA